MMLNCCRRHVFVHGLQSRHCRQHSTTTTFANRVLRIVVPTNAVRRSCRALPPSTVSVSSRLFSKSTSDDSGTSIDSNYDDDDDNGNDNDKSIRLSTLHSQLSLLGVDANELHQAALQSIQDPSQGYDMRFGKSAIKTYRAHLLTTTTNTSTPTTSSVDNEFELLQRQAAASRVARQVDFLIKRHKSSEAEWVRHLDDTNKQETTFTSTTNKRKNRTTSFPLILVLDNVRSALNVGSLFRTADATGCSLVITTGITPHPNGNGADKLAKSGLGAERVVPHLHLPTMLDALDYLRREKCGYTVIGMETTEKSKQYTLMTYPKDGCALILGNEVTGTAVAALLLCILSRPYLLTTFLYAYVHLSSSPRHYCYYYCCMHRCRHGNYAPVGRDY